MVDDAFEGHYLQDKTLEIATTSGVDSPVVDEEQLHAFVHSKRQLASQGLPQETTSKDHLFSRTLYKPLGKHEIRLLEIQSAESYSDDLVCSLRLVSIEFEYHYTDANFRMHTRHADCLHNYEPVWYTALSYVWGKPEFSKQIYFQGHKVGS
jgi:hypothetical protein